MTETPDSPPEPSLQKLGRYEIRAELGRGGFATVYRALDPNLDREVALKVLHPQLLVDRTFVARFRKEARALANLRHAHIVTVYEVSEADGRLFIAMELAHGPSLADAIAQRGRIPWAEALDILRPVCAALDYAHSQGIVHRDLKPGNILLDKERGPLLTDFGLARIMGGSSMSISISGGIVGTPAYIAPEVWEEEAARPAADIYALGCVCYEMVTGALLFNGATPMHIMRAHDKGPQFAAWPEGTPLGLEAALRIALAAEPGARYPSSEAFWHALNDAEANAQSAREQAEREAVAAQWQAEVEQAIAEGEWSVAKKAVGRWLKITPESEAAQAARRRIEGQEAREEEARRKEQEEEDAARKAREEQEREAARVAEEEAQRRERAEAKQKAQEEAAAKAAAQRAQTVQTEPKPAAKRQLPVGKLVAGGLGGIVLIALIIFGIGQLGLRSPAKPTTIPTTVVVAATDTPHPTATHTATPRPMAATSTPWPTDTPAFALGDTRTREKDGMVMVYIPAGEFQMGSTDEQLQYAVELCVSAGFAKSDCEVWVANQKPVHTVVLDAFWIDRTEVTNAQYQTCVAAGNCVASTYKNDSDFNGATQPVVGVDWNNAKAYCAWAGGQLPTEAQWEYAARGPRSLVYPWGNAFDGTKANYCDKNCAYDWADKTVNDGYAVTAPVGSFPEGKSWVGAWDMAGNVWEWTADWYEDYPSAKQTNPTGASSGEYRVVRGGSWSFRADGLRTAYRYGGTTTNARDFLGFRCVGARTQD